MAYVLPHAQAGKQIGLLVYPAEMNANGFHVPGGHYLVFPVNPDIQFQRAIRTTATQTIQGAWIDDFGLGIGQLTVTGHTGWAGIVGGYAENGGPVTPCNGFEAFQHLWYDLIEYYFALESAQVQQPPAVTMQWFNNIDEQFFVVKPTNALQLLRSKSKPYLYQYTLSFWVLYDHNHPGAVSPVADPIDPLINTRPDRSVSTLTLGPNPVSQALPPPGHVVTVQAGQTLWGIAAQWLTQQGQPTNNAAIATVVQAIAQANQLANPNLIYPGQQLTIPA